jgi:hypothetical protein
MYDYKMEQILKQVCDLAVKDHHKHRDGLINFEYDAWNDEWNYNYYGYVLDKFEGTEKTFEKAKQKVKEKLKILLSSN